MSKNRNDISDFLPPKSLSTTDQKYSFLFKYRRKIPKSYSDYNINNYNNKSITSIQPLKSTNAKLNQIILNYEQKSKKNIRHQLFFENDNKNNNNDKDNDLQKRIKKLLKNDKFINKKNIYDERDRLDGIHESLKRLLKWKEKYALNKSLYNYIVRENNKTPPVCRYTPNLESIKKHIPAVDLKGHKSINIKRIKKVNEKTENKSNLYSKHNLEEDMESKMNIKNNDITSINSYNDKNNYLNYELNNYKRIDQKDYSNFVDSQLNCNRQISYSISNELTILNPNKLTNNISSPSFKKMIGRDKDSNLYSQRYLMDYSPNYNYIYSNANKNVSFNQKLKNKKIKLRKIMSSSNPPSEYLLLPILNKK
mgnify:CR=1 FL=1